MQTNPALRGNVDRPESELSEATTSEGVIDVLCDEQIESPKPVRIDGAGLLLSPEALAAVDARDNNGQLFSSASTMLERYDSLVRSGIRSLIHRGFTTAHFTCAADALRGTLCLFDCRSVGRDVAEAIRYDELDKKWGIDEDAVATFESLDLTECIGLLDAVERFWYAVRQGKGDDQVGWASYWESVL